MQTITYHKSGFGIPLLGMLGMAMLIESTAIHVAVGVHNLVVTAVLGILHIASLWWIVAQIRAMIARPHIITADRLSLNLGTIYALEIPRANIATIRPYNPRTDKDLTIQTFDLINGATPKIVVELTEPLPVLIMGIKKRYTSYIGLTTDNDNALLALARGDA